MQPLHLVLCCIFAALTAAQSDVLFFTRVPNPVTDGEEQVILWSTNDTDTDVTLKLLQGNSEPYDTVYTITDSAQDGQVRLIACEAARQVHEHLLIANSISGLRRNGYRMATTTDFRSRKTPEPCIAFQWPRQA